MKTLNSFLTGYAFRTFALGAFCAIGAFAVGVETAGEVHPFAKSEAAIQNIVSDFGPIMGDANGNGMLDPADAYVVFRATEGLIVPSEKEVLRGDMDGDGLLTHNDLSSILQLLSLP